MLTADLLRRCRRVLLLGAHSDDIEIGCGGVVLTLRRLAPEARLRWVVFSGDAARQAEARRGAEAFAGEAAEVTTHAFRDGFFPQQAAEIKEQFERLKDEPAPDLILTHFRHDRHQDHRTLSDLTWNTFRAHLILEYEIPKWDGDLSQPNAYFHVAAEDVDAKMKGLQAVFGSQRGKHWFDDETFRGLMRLRGLESNARYAEAFHARKIVL
jgi:LmbE family N-acetylglucosaminyl deacetylase